MCLCDRLLVTKCLKIQFKMVHRSELSGLKKEKTHSSENAQVQGLRMREKAENVQRKTLKELQKAAELLIRTL